jgi:hypothetical protein
MISGRNRAAVLIPCTKAFPSAYKRIPSLPFTSSRQKLSLSPCRRLFMVRVRAQASDARGAERSRLTAGHAAGPA